MPVKPEFFVETRGQTFVKVAGLLDLAHEMGLEGLETEMLAFPNPDNGGIALFKAIVTMPEGKKFYGHGDASVKNVSPAMATAIIRMAETRATARALRNATNSAVTAYEELPPEEEQRPKNAARTPPPQEPKEEPLTQEKREELTERLLNDWKDVFPLNDKWLGIFYKKGATFENMTAADFGKAAAAKGLITETTLKTLLVKLCERKNVAIADCFEEGVTINNAPKAQLFKALLAADLAAKGEDN